MVIVRPLGREEAHAQFDALAKLRISVFREWPYLYDGDLAYERDYLATYFASSRAFIAGAFDGDQLVGACTASPLKDHADEFAAPFNAQNLKVSNYYYFGESVLLLPYRGQGIGVEFFGLREAAARRQGFDRCVFCAVKRSDNHPMKPPNYKPLDAFWRKRGYAKMDGLEAEFAWKDLGDTTETSKTMQFWQKRLT
ncbi:MAG: GNAT family N-acetyltransferase [Pseudomonadota bacterium]